MSTVTLSGGATTASLQLAGGNSLDITSGSTLAAFGPSIINAGAIQLGSGSSGAANLNIDGNVTLNGGGTLTMNGSGGGAFLQGTNVTLTNADNTIQGFGQIVLQGSSMFVNGGTVNANSTGNSLIVRPQAVTNSNLLEATNSGTLDLAVVSAINNAGGNITANGGTVVIDGTTVQGGTLNTLNGGTMMTGNGGTLDGSTQGALTISNGSTYTSGSSTTTTLLGTITNQGTIQLGTGGSGAAALTIGNNVTLNGGGTLTMNGGGGGAFLQGTNVTLTNDDNTIQGFGTIGINSISLVNNGTVNANSPAGTLTLNTGGTITNNGIFAASNGGTFTAVVPFTNSGTVHAINGTINANQGFTGVTGTAQIDAAGTLTVGANSTVGTLIHNGSGAASLNLGNNNITVSTDYVNGNFGIGNSFNKLANVATTGGQILAAGPTPANMEVITGARVSNGNTTTPTIALGTVHVGDSTTYQIANQGTAGSNPSLRGVIQTSVNGGNITGGLLSGTGVTAGNFGPIAPGASSGDFTVTAATAGSVSGQAIHIANNFGNVPEQTISFTGTVNNYAALAFLQQGGQGSLTGGGTSYLLDFGNILQGSGTAEALLGFLNNNPISEQLFTDLLSSSATITGGSGFSLSGDSVAGLAGGDIQAGFDIGLDTASAGSLLETLTFDVESSNNSGYDKIIGDVTLTLEAQVVSTSPVPEPGSFPLFASGLGMLLILLRRQRRRL